MPHTSQSQQNDFAGHDQLAHLRAELMKVAAARAGCQADAEDLVQGTLVRALEHKARFDGSNIRAWVRRILNNLAIDAWRKASHSVPFEPSIMERYAAHPVDERPAWDWLGEEEVLAALASCPRSLRAPYEMALLQGLSHAEIACELKIRPATVGTRIHRARAMLRRKLERQTASAC